MGFFNFLDPPPPRVRALHSSSFNSIPIPSGKAIEHHVSVDLVSSPLSRKSSISRPSRTPRALPIPMEVVLAIIEAAYYDHDLDPDETLLKACTLVCKSWAAPAQKLLFSNVILRTHTAYLAFRYAVNRDREHGRVLGDAVVRMRVVLDHNQPSRLSHHSFAHAVSLCPNLYELNLALYSCITPAKDVVGDPDISRISRHAPPFDEATLSMLRSGPRIKSLHFSNWSENRQSITQFLDLWPTLKALVISGTPPQLPSTSLDPFPCSLEELRMNFQKPPPIDFMKWLLHNSSGSLRILELQREPTSDFLDYLIDAHGAALHSLALPACASHEPARAIQRCQQLREFRIENPCVSPVVYKKLPDLLRHIALGLDRDTVLQPVLEIVKSSETLRVVTVLLWDGGERHPQLAALKIACAYRGLDLRVTADVRLFRAMIRGDSVPHQTFPRTKTLESLNAMRSTSL